MALSVPRAINISAKKAEIVKATRSLFREIMKTPAEERGDTKERTGLRLLGEEQSTLRNSFLTSFGKPSEFAGRCVVEKAVRVKRDGVASSHNSRNPTIDEWGGCIVVSIDGIRYSFSSSGAQEDEDALFSIKQASIATEMTMLEVYKNVSLHCGILPKSFQDTNHYLGKHIH